MTQEQLYRQIADFTGDKKDARRKAKIFAENCRVYMREVIEVKLSFGRYSDGLKYFGENRDTLNFDYIDNEGDSHHFAIIE